MRILVTGGAGFIGSHLCDRLIEQGNKVVCLDNFYTGSIKNIEHHLDNPDFELIEHDVTDEFMFEVDQIYNLACPASPKHYQKDPIKTLRTSVIGAINALNLAKRTRARILQASTSEVYGDPYVHPQVEDYCGNVNPIGPRACYDEGKRCAETLFFDYQRENDLDIRVVRIFNTYGPKMSHDDGRVVSNFITQALNGENITVYGKGKQTRSFCYVDDLVDGLLSMMNKKDFSGPVNLGSEDEFEIIELSNLIIKLIKSDSKIIHCNSPVDDPAQRRPDTNLALRKLKWKSSTLLEDGLNKTIEYFSKNK